MADILTVGIDPGKTGAAALLLNGNFVDLIDWQEDTEKLVRRLDEWRLFYGRYNAAVEKVHAMPRQGVSSTFNFGANFGWWRGYLSANGISPVLVTPQKWMAYHRTVSKRREKGSTIACARVLHPSAPLTLKKHDGRADALLIASWLHHVLSTTD